MIDSTTAKGAMYNNGTLVEIYAKFRFNISKPGIYKVRASYKGYDDEIVTYDLTNIRKREIEREMPAILLQRTIKKSLEEVTVTATKVKFYNNGDTLIYNADAFNLAEGSMLDALIRQLPGAELKSDGRIYVNGKFVESLMLNGKDFFKGNNQVLLDNLPTYMVQNIKVYDKQGERSSFLGYDTGDTEYVMDVNLKKQYRIGWVGNIEAGAGTENLWLARLFAMRFTDHSQVSFYGNMNNVNDSRKPGQDSDWTPDKMPTGRATTKTAGVDYSIDARNKKWKMNGNAQFKYVDGNTETLTHRTNFLSGGNTFDRIQNNVTNENAEVSTNHKFYYEWKNADLVLKPRFSYEHHKKNSSYYSATSNYEWDTLNKTLIDSLYMPTLSKNLRNSLLNRNIKLSLLNGHTWSGGMDFASTIKMKYSSDAVDINGWAVWNGAGEKTYEQNRADYFSNGLTTTDYRNQYAKMQPGRGYDLKAAASYLYKINTSNSITLGYGYRKRYDMKSKDLFRLDRLAGWGVDDSHTIGDLPSEQTYASTQDFSNSYASRLYEDTHEAAFHYWFNGNLNEKYWAWSQVDVTMPLLTQKLKYQRSSVDTTFTRHSLLPYANSFIQIGTNDRKHRICLQYILNAKSPDMTYMVNYRDDSDPLNTFVGNSGLKNTLNHKLSFSYEHNNSEKQLWLKTYMAYLYNQNALAMGYVYDKQTGHRTTTPDNVNGNYEIDGHVYLSTPLNKKRTFSVYSDSHAGFVHSVDLVGIDGVSEAVRSTVTTTTLSEWAKFDYKIGKHSISAIGYVSWFHSTSKLASFETINAFDFNYGLTANIKLPWNFDLNTDLKMYSRRGYEDSDMNSDDLVWNARLSYPMMKGKLRLMLDGFDIFHQLSNIQRYINAQGRTEVRTNVIPRYVMLHAVYRLNIMPKKK